MVTVAAEPEKVDELADLGQSGAPMAAGPGQAEGGREQARSTICLERNEQGLVDRELGKECRRLEGSSEPERGPVPG